MHILIDMERLCVLYKNQNAAALMNVANIEIPRSAVVVMDAEDHDSYERFTDYELKEMFYNICGQKFTGYNRPFLIKSVVMLVGLLEVSKLNAAELDAQVDYLVKTVDIHDLQNGQYRYVPGALQPAAQADVFTVPALTSVKGYQPTPKTYYARPAIPKVVTAMTGTKNAQIPDAHIPQPRDPNAPPRTPSEPSGPPKAGSKTGRVWEIADQCYAQHPTIDKALRALVAAACEKEGINSSTMSVQFSKWKHSKN